jgi:hypothetical protein
MTTFCPLPILPNSEGLKENTKKFLYNIHHKVHNEDLANVFERAASAAGRLGGADCSSWQNNKKFALPIQE